MTTSRFTAGRDFLILGVILALGLFIRLDVLGAGLDRFVEIMPDDAFYYYKMGQRFLGGQGITLDGDAPATGFHLLWPILTAPFFYGASPGAVEPVRMVLILASVLAGLAAFQAYRFACLILRPYPFWIAALLGLALSLNFYMVVESLNGLETALALFLVATVALETYRYLQDPRLRGAVLLAVVSFLSVLARSDVSIIIACLCAALLIRRAPLKHVAIIFGGAAAAVLVISTFCLIMTGRFMQSSATAMPWVIHDSWRHFHPHPTLADFHFEAASVMKRGFGMALKSLGPTGSIVTALSWLVLAFLLVRSRKAFSKETTDGLFVCSALLLGLVGLHVAHGYVRWYPRPWYFVYWALAAYMFAAVAANALLDGISEGRGHTRKAIYVALALLAAGAASLEAHGSRARLREARYPWQPEMVLAGKNLAGHIPHGQPVGSFNAGIISYMTDATVVNLDGAVNEDAARYIRNRRLGAYLCKRGISYMVDYPGQWGWYSDYWRALGPYMGEGYGADVFSEKAKLDMPGVGCPTAADHVSLVKINHPKGVCDKDDHFQK